MVLFNFLVNIYMQVSSKKTISSSKNYILVNNIAGIKI